MIRTADTEGGDHHAHRFSAGLTRAIRAGDLERVRHLRKVHGAALLQRSRADGTGAMHLAVETDDPAFIGELLALGVAPTQADRNGETPIAYAARTGRARAFRALLPVSRAISRKALALRAIDHQQEGVLRTLINVGLTGADRAGRRGTLLHAAAAAGAPGCLRLLIEDGFEIEQRDMADRTPLHIASARARPESVAVLLAAGADPHARDGFNQTPPEIIGHLDSDARRGAECRDLFVAAWRERIFRGAPVEGRPAADAPEDAPSL